MHFIFKSNYYILILLVGIFGIQVSTDKNLSVHLFSDFGFMEGPPYALLEGRQLHWRQMILVHLIFITFLSLSSLICKISLQYLPQGPLGFNEMTYLKGHGIELAFKKHYLFLLNGHKNIVRNGRKSPHSNRKSGTWVQMDPFVFGALPPSVFLVLTHSFQSTSTLKTAI